MLGKEMGAKKDAEEEIRFREKLLSWAAAALFRLIWQPIYGKQG